MDRDFTRLQTEHEAMRQRKSAKRRVAEEARLAAQAEEINRRSRQLEAERHARWLEERAQQVARRERERTEAEERRLREEAEEAARVLRADEASKAWWSPLSEEQAQEYAAIVPADVVQLKTVSYVARRR
ncbi:hypothetical protein [Streptomyces sp. PvR018]|uniref:hypothetical protein n=1 Tax=Streptomyces sp. PvR018 TaxID=3156442 RepID=UPI0033957B33